MSLITIEPGALPDNVTPSHLERMPWVMMVRYVRNMGAELDGLHIRRRNVGDLTMTELAARGCETDEARKAFVESEGWTDGS